MDDVHNPIEDLYQILEVLTQQAQATPTLKAWSVALDFDPGDTVTVIRKFSWLLDLISRCKSASEHIPGDKELFLAPLTRVEKLLRAQNLNGQWASTSGYLDAATMTGLKFGIYAMQQFYPGAKPEQSTVIREFIQKLNELLEECLDSELSDEVKALFVRHLETIRAALLQTRFEGKDGLSDMLDSVYGSLIRHSDVINNEPSESTEIIQKFFTILGQANDMVSGWQNLSPLLAYSAPVLLPMFKALV